jgi:hypothetical protein
MTITRRADVTLAEIDEALTRLCQMLARAIAAPDLPNVRRFLERIDELLEERSALTQDLQPQGASCTR